jgi:hypothetical protein
MYEDARLGKEGSGRSTRILPRLPRPVLHPACCLVHLSCSCMLWSGQLLLVELVYGCCGACLLFADLEGSHV